jgi:capsular polysaccharide biosynthesis protein
MELKQYWAIFRRRAWVIVLLTLIAGVASLLVSPKVQTNYISSIRVMISVAREPKTDGVYQYDGYYTWVASEYLVDDTAELAKSNAFAADLRKELAGSSVDPNAIQPAIDTKKSHRLLTISFSAPNADWAAQIAGAAAKVISNQSDSYFAQLSYEKPQFSVVDPPSVTAATSGLRSDLDIALRTILGFVAGIALALLLDYLDSSVRDRRELEDLLQVPVLGEIPPQGSGGFLLRKARLP